MAIELNPYPYVEVFVRHDNDVALAEVIIDDQIFTGSAKRNQVDFPIEEVGVNLALGRALRTAGAALTDAALNRNNKAQEGRRLAERTQAKRERKLAARAARIDRHARAAASESGPARGADTGLGGSDGQP